MSARILAAFALAERAHRGQVRKYTQVPYIVHPVRVAQNLSDILAVLYGYVIQDEVIAAAILHDVLEDTQVTESEMRVLMGDRVTDLVLEVTDVSKPSDGNRPARKAIDRAHLAKASVEGQLIKYADLMDNTDDIVQHDRDFARVYIPEALVTLDVLDKLPEALRNTMRGNLREALRSLDV